MEKLDLTVLLKDFPKGTELYSPIFGNVTFEGISNGKDIYPVMVKCDIIGLKTFTKDGRYYGLENTECTLFPSKENRDWSTFNKEVNQTKFEPFQKVLVRDSKKEIWRASLFSHLEKTEGFKYYCVGCPYKMCIPYEGNEELIGTTFDPKL